ncbi:MAG: FAD-dependent oxidoreductase [Pseudomonadota bacterium]
MSDILIIGGGIAGLSAGAALAPHTRVTLIEGERALGYHSSGRSAALFEELYGAPPVQALNKASAAAHAPYLSPRGLMLVAKAHEADHFAADRAAMGLTEISANEARAMVPILRDEVVLAAHTPASQDIDTDRQLQDHARTIRSHGGRVETGQHVIAIRKGTGWTATTDRSSYGADLIVNAAGAWADGLAQLAGIAPMGIVPHRRSMARIPAPGGHDVRHWPMLFGVGESWYAKPDAGKLLVSPADEDPVAPMDAWPDDMVLAEGLDRYSGYVTEPVVRLDSSWAGLRSFAPDRVLVLGPDAHEPSFIWCAGQGGYGFQSAPAAARLLADLILQRTPELAPDVVDALSAHRFAHRPEYAA